jgi:membrane AbrB-like protein
MARGWPTFIGGVVSVIVVSVALGWLLTRLRVLPGSTAVWGAFPGAATVMTLMAEGFGADARLVALMQYMRVVMVAVAATAVARFWTAVTPAAATAIIWFPPVSWTSVAATAALVALSAVAGRILRAPAGPMLVAMGAGALLQNLGVLKIELPPWLLAPTYLLVGWSIGARFNRPILAHAARVAPAVAASIACLIAACGVLGAALAHFAHVDALTAYLATSPGGADSVAIIAASTKVDMPFIMAMQMARLLVVLFTGPAIARFVSNRARR